MIVFVCEIGRIVMRLDGLGGLGLNGIGFDRTVMTLC